MRASFLYKPLLLLFLLHFFYSCTNEDFLSEHNVDVTNRESIIIKDNLPITIRRLNSDIIQGYYYYQGSQLTGQGMAVYEDRLYRFHSSGLCRVYDIHDLDNISFIYEFPLETFGTGGHYNCCNFLKAPYVEADRKVAYISFLRRTGIVEEFKEDGSSTLLQKIEIVPPNYLWVNTLNIICGDDGYLWAFGGYTNKEIQRLSFLKFQRPELNQTLVTLSENDILFSWSVDGYIYDESVWQGGTVFEGRLYFLYGTARTYRHIEVYDTATGRLLFDVPIGDFIKEEPEDLDFIDDCRMIVTTNGGTNVYLISNLPQVDPVLLDNNKKIKVKPLP